MLVCRDLPQMWKKWLSCSDPSRLGICRGCVCRGAQAWIVVSRGRQLQWPLAPFTATPSITGSQVKLTFGLCFVFVFLQWSEKFHSHYLHWKHSKRQKKLVVGNESVVASMLWLVFAVSEGDSKCLYHFPNDQCFHIRGRTVLTVSLLPVVLEGTAPSAFPQLSQPAEKTQTKKGGRSALTPDEWHANILD